MKVILEANWAVYCGNNGGLLKDDISSLIEFANTLSTSKGKIVDRIIINSIDYIGVENGEAKCWLNPSKPDSLTQILHYDDFKNRVAMLGIKTFPKRWYIKNNYTKEFETLVIPFLNKKYNVNYYSGQDYYFVYDGFIFRGDSFDAKTKKMFNECTEITIDEFRIFSMKEFKTNYKLLPDKYELNWAIRLPLLKSDAKIVHDYIYNNYDWSSICLNDFHQENGWIGVRQGKYYKWMWPPLSDMMLSIENFKDLIGVSVKNWFIDFNKTPVTSQNRKDVRRYLGEKYNMVGSIPDAGVYGELNNKPFYVGKLQLKLSSELTFEDEITIEDFYFFSGIKSDTIKILKTPKTNKSNLKTNNHEHYTGQKIEVNRTVAKIRVGQTVRGQSIACRTKEATVSVRPLSNKTISVC